MHLIDIKLIESKNEAPLCWKGREVRRGGEGGGSLGGCSNSASFGKMNASF